MAASVGNQKLHLRKPSLKGVIGAGINRRSDYPASQVPPLQDDVDYSSSDDEKDHGSDYIDIINKGKGKLEPSILDWRDEGTADNWIERNTWLLRLTGKHPFNCEAPLSQLMDHGFITPVPLHYVRNHGAVPKATWESWTVEICGLVKRPASLTIQQLVTEFPSKEFPATLVCAGNRRKEQNMVKQTIGFNWGAAGVSTAVWKGVPLHHVLKRCGIYSRKNGGLNVCFEGAEDLPGGGGGGTKYGTSIKKEFAMDKSRDIILAYMQNGELLKPDHGFPVRVIIPGFIGGRMVKWLKRIVVTTGESDNYYHYNDNRVLPSHVDAELANAEAWWYKPEYIINELNINSVITAPSHDEILPINSEAHYTLKGYAYSGGGKKVTRVEVTFDRGESWRVANLDHQEKPNKYGKYWCWCFWSLEVEVLSLVAAKEIAVRAWDETNTQPEKLIWNVMGMMNNCWFRVKTNVCRTRKGEVGIVFEHPTQPGNQSGGWMAKERQKSSDSVKKSVSSPFLNTASKAFSMLEVKKHNSAESAWIMVHGHIYDCTPFLKDHPGGADSILINAGTDCTEEFEAIHSNKAKKMLEDYRIGELIVTNDYISDSPNSTVHGSTTAVSNLAPIQEVAPVTKVLALTPSKKVACKLLSKTSISYNVRRFRFALPFEDQVLGLPIGNHIRLSAMIDDKSCKRPYTPTSTIDEVGYFELVVKIYFKNKVPEFPNGGRMSQYLDSIPVGTTLDVEGPFGNIEYTGKGNFMVDNTYKFAKKLAMLAGGTGITPIYQVMQAILNDPEDDTEMYVVYANCTEEDILLRNELDAWAEEYRDKVKVWYVVEQMNEGWKYSGGLITESILREHIPEVADDVLVLACGPRPMIELTVNPNLERMGYDIADSVLLF